MFLVGCLVSDGCVCVCLRDNELDQLVSIVSDRMLMHDNCLPGSCPEPGYDTYHYMTTTLVGALSTPSSANKRARSPTSEQQSQHRTVPRSDDALSRVSISDLGETCSDLIDRFVDTELERSSDMPAAALSAPNGTELPLQFSCSHTDDVPTSRPIRSGCDMGMPIAALSTAPLAAAADGPCAESATVPASVPPHDTAPTLGAHPASHPPAAAAQPEMQHRAPAPPDQHLVPPAARPAAPVGSDKDDGDLSDGDIPAPTSLQIPLTMLGFSNGPPPGSKPASKPASSSGPNSLESDEYGLIGRNTTPTSHYYGMPWAVVQSSFLAPRKLERAQDIDYIKKFHNVGGKKAELQANGTKLPHQFSCSHTDDDPTCFCRPVCNGCKKRMVLRTSQTDSTVDAKDGYGWKTFAPFWECTRHFYYLKDASNKVGNKAKKGKPPTPKNGSNNDHCKDLCDNGNGSFMPAYNHTKNVLASIETMEASDDHKHELAKTHWDLDLTQRQLEAMVMADTWAAAYLGKSWKAAINAETDAAATRMGAALMAKLNTLSAAAARR